ncbi:MAG: transposase [Bacteroidia bacterium]
MKEIKLIALYYYICDCYDTELRWICQRFSNNSRPAFSDEECLCIYLYAMIEEEKHTIKSMYDYADRYLRTWFPDLPSYQAFNARVNRLSEAFPALVKRLLRDTPSDNVDLSMSLVDSMPIITCSGRRAGKVAPELTNKGYCSTKKLHYYGVKLHGIAFHKPGGLPFPEVLTLTSASEHDLTALKSTFLLMKNRHLYADKAYANEPLNKHLQAQLNSAIFTPVKLKKGQSEWERAFNKAADDLFSRAVSTIRQPIESLFAWLIRKTDIQRASLIRSDKGLIAHIFGRIAAVYAAKVPALNP